MVNNHPSGTPNPSQSDLSLTDKVKKAAEVMDIKLLDYLILNECGFYSFADEGGSRLIYSGFGMKRVALVIDIEFILFQDEDRFDVWCGNFDGSIS